MITISRNVLGILSLGIVLLMGLPSPFGAVATNGIAMAQEVVAPEKPASIDAAWKMGQPIVSYWAGPTMSYALAKQLADGNWNLVWCSSETDLDIIQKHGLRGIVSSGLFKPKTMDTPEAMSQLEAFVSSVQTHPALYAYHLKDEPNASTFSDLAKMKDYLDEKSPTALKYVNLYPNYANAEQLGTDGQPVHRQAYEEHLRRFVQECKPQLLSYDHYHFSVKGDGDKYFLNLAQVRQASLEADLPFMVIVQACSWTINMRIPSGDELRWLVNTTLAYGSQGISYYVLGYRGHDGAMINLADGSPTPLYFAAKKLNKDFITVATELKPLRSLAVYHVGSLPEGTAELPQNSPFRIEPAVSFKESSPNEPVQGFVIGLFGEGQSATHAIVVNLDYRTYAGRGQPRREEFLKPIKRFLAGPGPLERFDVEAAKWLPVDADRVELHLPPSGALLVRVR